jgi:pyruvate dehydrogenase E1 component
MYRDGEDVFYYLTLYNENYKMPWMSEGIEEGILKGMYRFQKSEAKKGKPKVHLLGSGTLLREALRARDILEQKFGVSADVWSVTSYNLLRREALEVQRWNLLHPTQTPKVSYVEKLLAKEEGVFVAVSDYMKTLPDQIAPWVPGGLMTLGTDGFGRSDTRANLRRFFEIDAEFTAVASLYALAKKGLADRETVAKAIKTLGIDPEKVHAAIAY